MAQKATIFKAHLQLADMDRGVYADHHLTLARHPSETDERMMVRLLAFALHVPADNHHGALEFAKGLWDPDEPELWLKDLTGRIVHWIEIGQPDDRRLMKASGRAEKVTVIGYGQSTPIWWNGIATKITRARNIGVWQIAPAAAQALGDLARRSMQLQVSVQDGTAFVGSADGAVEVDPVRLNG
ncbi:MAG: YaeQ family protein [Pseudomonadota bacterium]|nr:YaeQ family protein [Pseudomonadota bacterium]